MIDGDLRSAHGVRAGSTASPARRRPILAAAVVAACLTVFAGACSSSEDPPPPPESETGTTAPPEAEPSVLRIGIRPIDSLDPAEVVPTSQSAMVASDLLFDSLAAIDPDTGQVVPALAAAPVTDDASTVWTFALRGDARFSDGSPVTAADVKFSLERVAQKGSSSLAGVRLEIIAGYQEFLAGTTPDLSGVVGLDEHTVQITTRVPYAQLAQLLASPLYGIVPAASVESLGATFRDDPVGSGPYALASVDGPTRTLELASGSTATIDLIKLIEHASTEESFAAFEAGDLDWSIVPDAVTAEDAGKTGDYQAGPFAAELFFGINMANPSFADVRFRSAMVKAIDRSRLVTEIVASPTPLNGVVPPSVTTASEDPCGDLCSYDPDGARALVAQAFPAGNVPNVQIDFYADPGETDTTQQELAEAVRADLEAVGIPVTLAPKPFAEYRTFAVSGGAQVFSYGWVGVAPNPDAYLAPLFLSDSPDNVTGYSNPFVDLFIADARTGDPATRDARYHDVERLVMSNVPIVPLAELETRVVINRDLAGYAGRLDGTFAVERLTLPS